MFRSGSFFQRTGIFDVTDMVVFTQTGRGAYLRESKHRERSSFESGTESHHHCHHHPRQARDREGGSGSPRSTAYSAVALCFSPTQDVVFLITVIPSITAGQQLALSWRGHRQQVSPHPGGHTSAPAGEAMLLLWGEKAQTGSTSPIFLSAGTYFQYLILQRLGWALTASPARCGSEGAPAVQRAPRGPPG